MMSSVVMSVAFGLLCGAVVALVFALIFEDM
jgi:hypothetical protein